MRLRKVLFLTACCHYISGERILEKLGAMNHASTYVLDQGLRNGETSQNRSQQDAGRRYCSIGQGAEDGRGTLHVVIF